MVIEVEFPSFGIPLSIPVDALKSSHSGESPMFKLSELSVLMRNSE